MWVNHALQLGFVHIPRTGGTTVKWLIGGFERVTVKHHATLGEVAEPERFRGYRLFAIVRDPYSRIASAYHRACARQRGEAAMRAARHHISSCAVYLRFLADNGAIRPQVDYLDHPSLKPKVFRFEETSPVQVARAMNGAEDYREIKTSDYGDYARADWLDAEAVALVNELCRRDFIELGYSLLSWEQLRHG